MDERMLSVELWQHVPFIRSPEHKVEKSKGEFGGIYRSQLLCAWTPFRALIKSGQFLSTWQRLRSRASVSCLPAF